MITLTLYKNKSIGVFGLGKAGLATLDALIAGGAQVYAWDDSADSCAAAKVRFGDAVNIIDFKQWEWKNLAYLVVAPGVPLTHPAPHPVVAMAKQNTVQIIGDIELLFQAQPDATYIGITGTNGKSTTTSLIGHVLKQAGCNVEVGGNLGTAALSLKPLGKGGIYVLELSSYMLDLVHTTRFQVAAFLNITPDHLDRHGDMEGYIAAKMHIFDRQLESDAAVIALDDAYTESIARTLIARNNVRVIPVSAQQAVQKGIYAKDATLMDTTRAAFAPIDIANVQSLVGSHNWQNACVALAVCMQMGLSRDVIASGLASFGGLAHRMELVATIDGIRFINDSKATNADATANALAPFDPVYWIVGGKPKEGGIEALGKFFPKIRHAFLIGAATDEFATTLQGQVTYSKCGDLKTAFDAASKLAFKEKLPNAVVLLSPACASFDQWKSFEQRGDAFRSMAEGLMEMRRAV